MTKPVSNKSRRWEDPAIKRKSTPPPQIEQPEEEEEQKKLHRRTGGCWNCGNVFQIPNLKARKKKFCCDKCRYAYAAQHATAYGQLKSKFLKLIDQKTKALTDKIDKQAQEIARLRKDLDELRA